MSGGRCFWSACLLGAPLIGCFPLSSIAQRNDRPVEPRSVYSRTDRGVDELDRPRYRERESHRGWEVTSPQVSVTATTSREDARRAAGIVRETWSELGLIADAFTKVHHHPDFGLGSAQVLIDNEPPRERDIPLVAFNVDAGLNRVVINVAKGRPSLTEQIPLLRAAAAQTFLHVAELDRQLPDWVIDGMAQAMVFQFEGPEAAEAIAAPPRNATAADQLRNDRWRRFRIAPDRLEEPPRDPNAPPPAMVSYLLYGEDAKNAPAFLRSLESSIAQKRPDRALKEFDARRQPPAAEVMPIDRWAATAQPAFEKWLEQPDVELPLFVPSKTADEETAAREREMFVVLKLAERFTPRTAPEAGRDVRGAGFATPSAPKTTNPNVVRPKIVELPRASRDDASSPTNPPPANRTAGEPPRILTIGELIEKLDQDNDGVWATVDSNNGLLLSIHRKRLAQIAGAEGRNYKSRKDGDRWVWSTELADGRTLDGWLEPQSKTELTLVSKFAVRARR